MCRHRAVPTGIVVALVLSVTSAPLFAADKYTFNPTQVRNEILIADTTGKWAYMWPREFMWSWGSEMVVHCQKKPWSGDKRAGHEIDGKKPGSIPMMQMRSTDNGDTWTNEGALNVVGQANRPIKFLSPGFANREINSKGWFYLTYDQAKTWIGPYKDFEQYSVEICTDHFIAKDDGKTAHVVIPRRPRRDDGGVIRWRFGPASMLTTDAGLTWSVGGKWPDNTFKDTNGKGDYSKLIQPHTVRLGENELLSVGRSRFGGALYRSTDFGKSWAFEGVVHPEVRGFWIPCWLVVLGGEYPDNTNTQNIVAVWGARGGGEIGGESLKAGPRARSSKDGGRTWSDNVIQFRNDLQDGRIGFDTGELAAMQRTDGKIIAVYYWQTDTHPQPYIAYTVFDPNVEGKEQSDD